jgi:hypothetical protein
MPRPQKSGTDWFKHDSDMRNDPKILALRSKFGFEGYGIWCMLLETLSDSAGFRIKWTPEEIELYAGDYRMDAERLTEIVAYMARLKLLTIEKKTLYCPKHVERLKSLIEKREREQIRHRNKVSAAETNESAADSTQSRVEKSREEESKDNNPLNPPKGERRQAARTVNVSDLLEKFDDPTAAKNLVTQWLDYRKEIKKPFKSAKSVRGSVAKILKYSNGQIAAATTIVEESVSNGWQGIFEPKPGAANTSHTAPRDNGYYKPSNVPTYGSR